MNKFLESAGIALEAIWAAKLRSLMTVLGNIVAVTSIIAVVSLIQGLNASVKDAILNQAGADSFSIQQFPITRSDEEFEKVREQPAHHAAGRARDPALQPARSPRSWPTPTGSGRITYRDKSIDSTQVQGVTPEYVNFSTLRRRARPADEPDRGRHARGRSPSSAGRPPTGCSAPRSIRSTRPSRSRACTSASSASAPRSGSVLGQSQDEFAVIPLGQFQMMFGSRRQLSLTVKPRDLVADRRRRWTTRRVALRIARRLKPKQPDNFGMFTSDTILDIYHSATNGIFAVLVGVVGAVAGRRRHRHHEHHADGGDRADARDRPAQGARRAAVRHHGADAHRVGGPVGVRRRRRHDARRGDRAGHRVVHADSGGGRSLVGRARHRHHRAGRAVLRPLSGDRAPRASIRSKR